jgi:hypothetical protein
MIEVRPATQADVDTYWGKRPPQTLLAFAAVADGVVVSIAGLARGVDCKLLFWDITPGFEPQMKSMVVLRTIKRLMKLVEQSRLPVVTIAHNRELVARLGFVQVEDDLYQWPI